MSLTEMQADTVSILSDWAEDLTVKRPSVSYGNSGIPTNTWTTIGTYSGDWQSSGGDTRQAEAGLKVKTEATVIFPVTADVQENDRIYRSDSSYLYVDSVTKYEDHYTVFLTKTQRE